MTAEERQNADVILTNLSEYFIPKRNKMYERYMFNSLSQKTDESFDQFLTALRKHAATSKFSTKWSAIVSSLAYEIKDTANAFFGILR